MVGKTGVMLPLGKQTFGNDYNLSKELLRSPIFVLPNSLAPG
jgi:hypothetical protein